ncbi:MAG: nucleotidyl transferase AbiEii/AbiGii toxin family protein [Bryobacterales bacterium]|nr:nucleotidyl transferase AbiEii/AbiGii toxin family protein [Bryobacterales bacterium]
MRNPGRQRPNRIRNRGAADYPRGILRAGFGDAAPVAVAERVRSVASLPADDGILFDPSSIEAAVIREDAGYEGVRVKLAASRDQARIRLQVDIGFGDAVNPAPVRTAYPAILNHVAIPQARGCMNPDAAGR